MQVTSSNQNQTSAAKAGAGADATSSRRATGKRAVDVADGKPAASTKVTLSDEAKQKSAAANADPGKADTRKADGVTKAGEANDAAKGDAKPAPSPIKSLTYGALGLQDPQNAQKTNNTAYGVGKWIAAAGTVASLVLLALRLI